MSEIKKAKKNIEDIKSSYIIKEVFSFLSKKQKLNIIIYNKQLQNICGFDIEDYKKISGKYKIIDENGFGKEYELGTNRLIFEGEYLNGKRNGKGKEYNNYCKLEFEGEYINGKRNGKGKEYYFNGKLEFEGEYLNGKRWNGKGYNNDGDLQFELKNGNGKAKEYNYKGKLEFERVYLNGKKKWKRKRILL